MEEPFNHVISVANRLNVRSYTVDAHGLTTRSSNQGAIDTLSTATQSSLDQRADTSDQPVRGDEAQLLGTTIQSTRANYRPTLAADGKVLHAIEDPLLTALDSPELPKAFGFGATAMHFRGRQNQPFCDLVVDMPLAHVTFQKSRAADQFKGQPSYIALLKDGQSEVVKKFQSDIPILVPGAKLEALNGCQDGKVVWTRQGICPPRSVQALNGPILVEVCTKLVTKFLRAKQGPR